MPSEVMLLLVRLGRNCEIPRASHPAHFRIALDSTRTNFLTSQKFYKLKKESERLSANSSAPNTPTKTPTPRGPRKRKATENNAETETPQSNKKRSTKVSCQQTETPEIMLRSRLQENGISIKSEPAANSDSGEDTVD